MKRMAAAMITVFMFMANGAAGQTAPAAAQNPQAISIARSGSLQSTKGSAQYFTGTVQIQQLFAAHDPSRTSGGSVTFEPGAGSAWHTHPFGQILIVTEGAGWIQQWGGPIQEIRKGDVIWIPPGLSTGTALRQLRPGRISRYRSSSTARPLTGWRR